MARSVRARAWCRADLAGGTFDIWPLGLLHAGARTVNLAIDVQARVNFSERAAGFRLVQGGEALEASTATELAKRPGGELLGLLAEQLEMPPVEIEVSSDSPRGGGLGASSAIAVAALAGGEAFLGKEPSPRRRLARVARDVEVALMRLPTGTQDQLAALHGGVSEIRYRPGRTSVRALNVDLAALGESLVLVYSGQSHFSAGNNWQVYRRRIEGDAQVIEAFDGIAAAATAMPAALEAGDLQEVGRLMSVEWSHRRNLAPEVSTTVVERLLSEASAAGAWGGKVCGAGGGGCLAFLASPEGVASVRERLTAAGGKVLEARPAVGGVDVVVEDG